MVRSVANVISADYTWSHPLDDWSDDELIRLFESQTKLMLETLGEMERRGIPIETESDA